METDLYELHLKNIKLSDSFFNQNYILIKELGKGGFGYAYLAQSKKIMNL